MGAKRRKSKKRSSTNTPSEKQLKRTTFFLERSFGGKLVLEELRKAGLKVEPHQARFRHNTPDNEWLAVVGEKKWIVLMRDQNIGRRPLELEALRQAGVRSFVLVEGQLPDRENAKILIKANGARLTDLMMDYGVGVSHRTVKIPKIDSDYFEE